MTEAPSAPDNRQQEHQDEQTSIVIFETTLSACGPFRFLHHDPWFFCLHCLWNSQCHTRITRRQRERFSLGRYPSRNRSDSCILLYAFVLPRSFQVYSSNRVQMTNWLGCSPWFFMIIAYQPSKTMGPSCCDTVVVALLEKFLCGSKTQLAFVRRLKEQSQCSSSKRRAIVQVPMTHSSPHGIFARFRA
jgi:hypothetical protein